MAETDDLENDGHQFESLAVRAGLDRSENEVQDIPIYASTSFVFNDSAHGAAIFNMTAEAFCYSRIANPTVDVFEKRMAVLEGGEAALATASGEAALFVTITSLAQSGSNVIVASQVSQALAQQLKYRLPALGIIARFVESGNLDEVEKAIDQNSKAVFVESLSINSVVASDIKRLASVAHRNDIPLIVENTHGAGGFLLRPIDDGADIVFESAAPWLSISGCNRAGVIVDSGKFPWGKSQNRFPQFFEPSPGFHGLKFWEKFGKTAFLAFARAAVLRDAGPCLNPFEAAILLAGLETLAVRMRQVSSNALQLATWLESYGKASKVNYSGSGGIISLAWNEALDFPAFMSKFSLVSIGQSIGGSRTTIVPAPHTSIVDRDVTNTNERCHLVYVSVGLEAIIDLQADFKQAFSKMI